MIKRCIIILIISVYSTNTYAYEVSRTDNGSIMHWVSGAETYKINANGGPVGSFNAIQAAAQTWSDVPTSYNTSSGAIVDSDIRFNTIYPWGIYGSSGVFDVQNIATHEFGHSLSLKDLYNITDAEKTMYGYGGLGETQHRTLHQDDIDGITYIYFQITRYSFNFRYYGE